MVTEETMAHLGLATSLHPLGPPPSHPVLPLFIQSVPGPSSPGSPVQPLPFLESSLSFPFYLIL